MVFAHFFNCEIFLPTAYFFNFLNFLLIFLIILFPLGSKKDVWISVNPETGERIDILATSISPSFCPANHPHAIHIGKTEYQIQMVDTKRRDRHWNATFVDYSSHLLPGRNLLN